MARTAPFPNVAAIPGMNPGVFVMGGGTDNGGSGPGGGKGRGNGQGAGGGNGGNNAGGDGRSAPDVNRYPDCGTAAHPVDVVTGRAFTHPILDVALPGPLPLLWRRVYSTAARERDFGLGWGWAHTLGWQIEVRRRTVRVWTDQGTVLDFPNMDVGGEALGPFGWLLRREEKGYVLDADDGVWRRFAEKAEDGALFRLTSIEDRNRNTIALEYDWAHRLPLGSRSLRRSHGATGRNDIHAPTLSGPVRGRGDRPPLQPLSVLRPGRGTLHQPRSSWFAGGAEPIWVRLESDALDRPAGARATYSKQRSCLLEDGSNQRSRLRGEVQVQRSIRQTTEGSQSSAAEEVPWIPKL